MACFPGLGLRNIMEEARYSRGGGGVATFVLGRGVPHEPSNDDPTSDQTEE